MAIKSVHNVDLVLAILPASEAEVMVAGAPIAVSARKYTMLMEAMQHDFSDQMVMMKLKYKMTRIRLEHGVIHLRKRL
jgi:hypothetical protein